MNAQEMIDKLSRLPRDYQVVVHSRYGVPANMYIDVKDLDTQSGKVLINIKNHFEEEDEHKAVDSGTKQVS